MLKTTELRVGEFAAEKQLQSKVKEKSLEEHKL